MEENAVVNMQENKNQSRVRFSKEEDERLKELVERFGTNSWSNVSKHLKNRTKRQCRERWNNYLSSNNNISKWSNEEDELLIQLYSIYGTQWSTILSYFQQRTYNNVRNRLRQLLSCFKHNILNKQSKKSTTENRSRLSNSNDHCLANNTITNTNNNNNNNNSHKTKSFINPEIGYIFRIKCLNSNIINFPVISQSFLPISPKVANKQQIKDSRKGTKTEKPKKNIITHSNSTNEKKGKVIFPSCKDIPFIYDDSSHQLY